MSTPVPSSASAPERIHYAARPSTYFDLILPLFCVVLVVSNIVATKGIQFGSGHHEVAGITVWPILTDGGAFCFPLAYILGDVISEVYGFRAARRAILMGFAMSIFAAVVFLVVQHAPAASFYANQKSYEAVVGPVLRIIVASMCGYMSGQFINAFVMVRMKARAAEHRLWARLVGSTGAGEAVDTFIFCAIASSAIGITRVADFWNYFIVGFVFKCAVEYVVMPITMLVIGWLKDHEPTYWASQEPELVRGAGQEA